MKKNKLLGIIIFLSMFLVIVGAYIFENKLFYMNDMDDKEYDIKSTIIDEQKEEENITESENNDELYVKLRKYGFEVLSVTEGKTDYGTEYIEIELKVTNYDTTEQVLSLNNIYLVIEDENKNRIEEIIIENKKAIDNERVGVDYYHHNIPANQSSVERLFFLLDKNQIEDNYRIALHFNPYGTEGVIIYGKDEHGNRVEIQDTNNVADIYIESLLWGENH